MTPIGERSEPLVSTRDYDDAIERAKEAERGRTAAAASPKASPWDPATIRYDAPLDLSKLTEVFQKDSRNRIDQTARDYAGPYSIPGSNNAWEAPVSSIFPKPAGGALKAKELAGFVGADLAARIQSGQACPADIKRATQMLIDKNQLPGEAIGDPATRIRAMQRQFGIGVDGAAYTRRAAAAASGLASLPLGNDLGMRHLDTNPHFEKVKPGNTKPGDIITLDPLPGQKMGQNAVVFDNRTLGDVQAKAFIEKSPELTSFFLTGKGPFHEICVDSSWGADGKSESGQRQQVWLYDESTKQWAHQDPSTKKWTVSPNAPTDTNTFHGAYRVK